MSKAVGTLLIVVACIIMLPIVFAVFGALIGAVFGIIGGVIGVIFGVFGAIIGSIAAFFSWVFDGIFGWDGPSVFWHINPFTFFVVVIVLALLVRSRQNGQKSKTP